MEKGEREREGEREGEDEVSPLLSINVVNIDYTMVDTDKGHPNHDFIDTLDSKVPVVRIFGATSKGERACVHIHGVSLVRVRELG
jgi:hypothetical protein